LGARVKVLQKGKVTIPADIREALGLEEGDYVTVELKGSQVVVYPSGTLANPTEAIDGLVSGLMFTEPTDPEIGKAGAANMERKLRRGK